MSAASTFTGFGNNNLRRTRALYLFDEYVTLWRRFNYGDYYVRAGHSSKLTTFKLRTARQLNLDQICKMTDGSASIISRTCYFYFSR